jgi:hypothetical protein
VRGDEVRVVAAFCDYLRACRWAVTTEVDHCDVRAERDGAVMFAEAKGRTTARGLDIDTAYGQLLRRMPAEDESATRYALVVPADALWHAERVGRRVRRLLRIDVYSVDSGGAVTPHLITPED